MADGHGGVVIGSEISGGVRNIYVENVEVENGGETGILLEGYPSSPVTNLQLKNITIKKVQEPTRFSHAQDLSFEAVTINGETIQP